MLRLLRLDYAAEYSNAPFFSSSTHLLQNIDQLGIEFHKVMRNIRGFARIVKGLTSHGYKVVHWEPNMAAMPDKQTGYSLFEVVFRRTRVCQ